MCLTLEVMYSYSTQGRKAWRVSTLHFYKTDKQKIICISMRRQTCVAKKTSQGILQY